MFLNFAAYNYSNLKTMNPIIFMGFELQKLEATKIIGGKGEITIQDPCTNDTDGCAVGAVQIMCTNKEQCMCYILQNCSSEDACITPIQKSCL